MAGVMIPHHLERDILLALSEVYPAYLSPKVLPGREHPRFFDLLYLLKESGLIDAKFRESRRRANAGAPVSCGSVRLTGYGYSVCEDLETDEPPETMAERVEPDTPPQAERYSKCEPPPKTVTRKQIKLIFSKLDDGQWRGHFSREVKNGLGDSRVGEKGDPRYLLQGVCAWLESKGQYSPAEIGTALREYSEPNNQSS